MIPDWFINDGSWYSLASKDNDMYVAYFYNVTPFVTSTATGTLKNLDDAEVYRAQWYNPREGSYTPISSSVNPSGGQWIIPEKPDTLDWVLLLTNDGEYLSDGCWAGGGWNPMPWMNWEATMEPSWGMPHLHLTLKPGKENTAWSGRDERSSDDPGSPHNE